MAERTIIVCGGRDYADRDRVFRELDAAAGLHEPDAPMMPEGVAIVHGACPTGADRWADEWAVINWIAPRAFPADWSKHGRAAGPLRNQRMLDETKPDLVVAFPGGKGTADMVRRARAAGVTVREVGQ